MEGEKGTSCADVFAPLRDQLLVLTRWCIQPDIAIFMCLQASLERGLAPDDETLRQLTQDQDSPFAGMAVENLRWPDEPLRSSLIRKLSCTERCVLYCIVDSARCQGYQALLQM